MVETHDVLVVGSEDSRSDSSTERHLLGVVRVDGGRGKDTGCS